MVICAAAALRVASSSVDRRVVIARGLYTRGTRTHSTHNGCRVGCPHGPRNAALRAEVSLRHGQDCQHGNNREGHPSVDHGWMPRHHREAEVRGGHQTAPGLLAVASAQSCWTASRGNLFVYSCVTAEVACCFRTASLKSNHAVVVVYCFDRRATRQALRLGIGPHHPATGASWRRGRVMARRGTPRLAVDDPAGILPC